MTYVEHLNRLGDDTADRLVAIWQSLSEGLISEEEAIALIVAVIEAANNRATVLADLGVAADLTASTGIAVGAAGLVLASQRDRLTKAATTLLSVLDDTPDPEARIRRLGRSEPLTRAAEARGEAIEEQPTATGWVRQFNSPDPCELCVWWSRDGRGWPAGHRMPTHLGCTCTQRPTTRRKTA